MNTQSPVETRHSKSLPAAPRSSLHLATAAVMRRRSVADEALAEDLSCEADALAKQAERLTTLSSEVYRRAASNRMSAARLDGMPYDANESDTADELRVKVMRRDERRLAEAREAVARR